MCQASMDAHLIAQRVDLGFLIKLAKGVRKDQAVIVFVKLRAVGGIAAWWMFCAQTLWTKEALPMLGAGVLLLYWCCYCHGVYAYYDNEIKGKRASTRLRH